MRRFVNLSSLGARQNSQTPTGARAAAAAAAPRGGQSLLASSRLLRSSASSLSSLQADQSLQDVPVVRFRKLSSWVGDSSSSLNSGGGSDKSASGQSGGSKAASGSTKKRGVSKSSGSSNGSNNNSNSSQTGRSRSKSNGRTSQNQSDNLDNRSGATSSVTVNRQQQPGGGSVKHDKDGRRFTLDLGNNQVAHINYKPAGRNKLEFYHTEVPSELRGKGIGKALARGAFDCVSASNMKLKLTCSYLVDYLERFAEPKHKKLVER